MRLGYNTNGLQNHRLDDAIRLLADEGFEVVALTLDVGHLDPLRATAREIDEVAGLIARLGLGVVVETGARYVLDSSRKHEPTLMTDDPQARDRRVEFYARSAEIGADLGAGVLSFWAGTDRRPGPGSAGRLVDGVLRTCEVVRARGLIPSFEPEPGMAVDDMAAFAALLEACGAGAPALTLDVGHLYVTEREPPPHLCRTWAGQCAQVHLEDVRSGVHEHLPPGEGDVDFPAVLRGLRSGGYAGPVCFELSRSSHRAPELLALCRETFRRAIAED